MAPAAFPNQKVTFSLDAYKFSKYIGFNAI
jgi:hypothetical protein